MSSNRGTLQVGGVWIPTPSTMTWGLQDLSAEDAGRTQDGVMHKNRFAQKRMLSLTWLGMKNSETAEILRAFNPEYIQVTYYDPMDGGRVARTFYVGDRKANFRRVLVGDNIYDTVAFDIIER